MIVDALGHFIVGVLLFVVIWLNSQRDTTFGYGVATGLIVASISHLFSYAWSVLL